MLEDGVHKSLVTALISQDADLEMDQNGQVLKRDIMAIKKLLEDRGYVLIPGQIMKELLTQFGATEEDFQVLESGYIHRYLPLDQQPVMRHRLVNIIIKKYLKMRQKLFQNSCHRVLLNTTDQSIFTADTHAITQYPSNEIASEEVDGARIAYKR